MKTNSLIAMLLCAMMLVSLLPAAVFADEGEDEEIVEVSFEAEEAEEALPEEPAEEETAEEPAEEEELPGEDGELPAEEEEILPEEPENEDAENEFEAAAGTCGDDATWSLTNSGVLTIKGTGNMDDYSVSNPGWLNSSIIVRTIKVEEGITSIGSYAFYSLRDAITEVSLPDSLLYINKCAFMECGITEIEIPASVKSIGERAFAKNPGLTVIRFDGNAPDIASDAFTDVSASVYYSESTGTWTDSNKLNYGGELNWVSDAAIYGVCGEKVTWKLDNGVLTISGTGEMTNNDDTMPWKNYSNYGKDIIKLVVTEGVTSICDYICSGCENLSAVSLPNTLKVIGEGAFWRCKKLENIVIPNSVTTIKDIAFLVCGLKSITIPASVTELGSELFMNCPQLSEINIVGTASGLKSVNGIVFSADGKTIVIYPGGKQDKSYTIPTGVTKIEECAFEVNKFLELVVIPDAVTSIGRSAFYYDTNLKSIVLPENITELSEQLFAWCESLVNITLPKGLKTLGNYVFYGCGSLGNISLPDSLLSIGDYAFSKCEKFTNVTVPAILCHQGENVVFWLTYTISQLNSENSKNPEAI